MKDYFLDLAEQYNASLPEQQDENVHTLEQPITTVVENPADAVVVASVLEITKEAMRCFTDYEKCVEHEKTERKRIAATLSAIEYKIDAQKEIYLDVLNKKYEEKNRLYDLAWGSLEKALERNDTYMLRLILNFILAVYNGSVDLSAMSSLLSDNQFK
jgi:hypothetical protein